MTYAAAPTQLSGHRFAAVNDAVAYERSAREIYRDTRAAGADTPIAHEIDLRQLRHHTKNTLQRIIGLIGELPGLHNTPEGRQLARELEHRIFLSATISNALFGFTDTPGSMAERLRQLAGAMVDMMRSADQTVRIGVLVRGTCPGHLREAVIRTAHELIGNAVKHGMRDRPSGRIVVRLVSQPAVTTLAIVDDGWGFDGRPGDGEGLALARSYDGVVATLELPNRC
jgi:two-component sensor histidine kinase